MGKFLWVQDIWGNSTPVAPTGNPQKVRAAIADTHQGSIQVQSDVAQGS
ncbi:MAG: hypothetical protein VKJ86_01280 [Synechococcus sp.]|nr:hypothetical protein [Synechococcus sp.]